MTAQPERVADLLAEILILQGARHVFGVPGESYLPLLDALYDRSEIIEFVTCRHEAGAAIAAEAMGKLTRRPGICMVTRGPGAMNASSGIHIAQQDSTPMIVLVGQVARSMSEREAFQEVDYRSVFGSMTKWTAELRDPSRIQEYIVRAYRTAMSGRPGPVVIVLPEDILSETVGYNPAPRWIEPPRHMPDEHSLQEFRALLGQSKKPMLIVGGSSWSDETIANMTRFSEQQDLPVAASFRCQSLMNNQHPNYIGHFNVVTPPYLADAIKDCDLVIAAGARLGEITTQGYALLDSPVPDKKLIHIYPQAEEIGRVYEPALSLVSDMASLFNLAVQWPQLRTKDKGEQLARLRAEYESFSEASSIPDDPVAPYFEHLSAALPDDAIICNGAGNYAAWLHRFYRYRPPRTQLAPTSGSMGYGLPAAIAACLNMPDRAVYAIAGDGCFMMTSQELATAARYGLNMTIIVINNERLGTIRAHQENHFPSRIVGTDLTNPDFVAFAQSFGASAWRAQTIDTFKQALSEASRERGIKLIEIPMDKNIIAPGKRLR